MSLWTPPTVSRELRESTREHTAEVFGMVERFHGILRYWNGVLKAKDPTLEMIFAPPNAKVVPGLLPGRYHIVKHVAGGPPSLLPIVGPAGEFMEPTDAVLRLLDERDLWNDRVRKAKQKYERAEALAKERQREREREEKRDEVNDRIRAAFETSVSMTPGWSQNASATARRGRRSRPRD